MRCTIWDSTGSQASCSDAWEENGPSLDLCTDNGAMIAMAMAIGAGDVARARRVAWAVRMVRW